MEQTTTGMGQPQAGRVDGALEACLRRFNDAFNRFDAEEVASCWADDGTLINPLGHYARGREDIARLFSQDARVLLEGATSRFTIASARSIGDDHVLLDVDHEAQNARMPDGGRGTMKIHVVILAQRTGQGWHWLDVRPYRFVERPPALH